MPTGACGIDCNVCRLQFLGVCSTCGPGGSEDAEKKMAVQVRILGSPCPILACAGENNVEYCLRDCTQFPCELFRTGPYPFSQGFLKMQERRRKETLQSKNPLGQTVVVPAGYWEELGERDIEVICRNALAQPHAPEGLLLTFTNEPYLVDLQGRSVKRASGGSWEKVGYPLLELLFLVYLLRAKDEPLCQEMVTVQQLKDAHFFQGPHALPTAPLLKRYGRDAEGFRQAAGMLGGDPLDLADVSFRIQAFPRVPMYYLLWEGDEEFDARLSVLFDRSVERHLSADAIWGLVHLITTALLGAEERLNPSGFGS